MNCNAGQTKSWQIYLLTPIFSFFFFLGRGEGRGGNVDLFLSKARVCFTFILSYSLVVRSGDGSG